MVTGYATEALAPCTQKKKKRMDTLHQKISNELATGELLNNKSSLIILQKLRFRNET
ncbi:hypothetical protein HMPREF3226_02333 [Prevotella corporis]|uniref:Uncharacterized protein n=1 Tax=Prevotella corporis TaxID=28128 RepID=A0A133PW62_9BACT|nr:hypothetical protein HMPREF3226_02333 [Prevotella corporis]